MQLIDLSRIKISCSNCGLHELCLPRGLDPNELTRLEYVVQQTRPLQKGNKLFNVGAKFSSLFVVRSGSIKLFIVDPTGDEQIIGFYLPGDFFGLDGVEDTFHKCTAVALETSSVCSFPYSDLTKICHDIPTLHEQLFHFVGREISDENKLLLTIAKKNADERIATFLISLSRRFKRLGYSANEFRLSMSRKDIGNYLGLNLETVSRTLSHLQKMNLIQIDRKNVKIIDYDKLQDICTHQIRTSFNYPSVA